jgi:hypothetical protein
MTLIAGILSRHDRPLADSACASLHQAVSRNPADEVKALRDRRSYFVKVNIEAFDEPGFFVDASGAFSLTCPLPIPNELAYQWEDTYQAEEDAPQKERAIEQATELLRSIDFPDQILSRRNLRLATWIHAKGWRDYRYAIEAAQTYYGYSKKCRGEFTFSVI